MALSIVMVMGYSIIYAAVHSWLASWRLKDWTRQVIGPTSDCWYRLAYNVIAGLTLLPLLILVARLPDRPLYEFPAPWVTMALAAQLVTAGCMVYGMWVTDFWHFLGIRQIFSSAPHECRQQHPPLAIFGLYRWVRHPIYLLGLILIWLTSTVTVNLAALFVVFSLYFLVGSYFEEKRLTAEYGDAYRNYQRQVPRIIPWRGPVNVSQWEATSDQDQKPDDPD